MWRNAELEVQKTVLLEKENLILDHVFFLLTFQVRHSYLECGLGI